MILAPLRGVTIRCLRKTFRRQIADAGFDEVFTPFIPAIHGVDPLRDRELSGEREKTLKVTPQFIGKDPTALRYCLERIKEAGFDTADLNCGCPFPMVRNKGRGSGILRTADVFKRMLEVGCEVMGEGRFSVKTRLGVDGNSELLGLMEIINSFPLRFITVHARNARQMYSGDCDREAFKAVRNVSAVPVVENGDLDWRQAEGMVGRSFIRHLGDLPDSPDLLRSYIADSAEELSGDRPVLGRIKELLTYWRGAPYWGKRWDAVKICRSTDELLSII